MKGWKTLIGGILAIGCGMYLIIYEKKYEPGMGLVTVGLLGLGIGHKIDKLGNK